MIERLRGFARHIWPVVRLRWVLFGTLLFVAALPGFAALGLNVYENALVRRTEAELNAQSAAIAATAALLWQREDRETEALSLDDGEELGGGRRTSSDRYYLRQTEIDLGSSEVLPSRPLAQPAQASANPDAVVVAARIAPVIAETKHTTLASILLLDGNGIVLNGAQAGGSFAALPEVKAALAGEAVTVLRQNDAYMRDTPLQWVSRAISVRLHNARPIVVDGRAVGVVLVSRSPAALFRGLSEDLGSIVAGTLTIFVLLVLLTLVLARAIVAPLEKLSEATKGLASGRQERPRRPTLEVREISSLFDDFEVMATSIERRSRYLRDFAASLSHEFKTPLAGLRGGIELLQDHRDSMTVAEYERFLANMNGDADRLSQLVSRLMELAQADMRGDASGQSANLHEIIARLADAMAEDEFCIESKISADIRDLAMEQAALETVLGTLIDNARQAGATQISINASSDDEYIRIKLVDNGSGVGSADRDSIFDPFFTTKRDSGGTGLGLPIAQALVQNQRGSLELEAGGVDERSEGATFVMQLPKAQGV